MVMSEVKKTAMGACAASLEDSTRDIERAYTADGKGLSMAEFYLRRAQVHATQAVASAILASGSKYA